jgi:hypothetical protein
MDTSRPCSPPERDQLILDNQKLAYRIASKYHHPDLARDDLRQLPDYRLPDYVRAALSKAVAQTDAIRRPNTDELRIPIHSLDAALTTDAEPEELSKDTFTVLSSEAVARRLPSALKHTLVTTSVCPWRVSAS